MQTLNSIGATEYLAATRVARLCQLDRLPGDE